MSWTCPDCGATVPDHKVYLRGGKQHIYMPVVCTVCAEEKSRAAYLARQKEFLPRIVAGEVELTLTYPANARLFHIRLIGEPRHAFCGMKTPGQWFKKYARLTEDLRAELCPRCLEVLDRLRKEIERAEVA